MGIALFRHPAQNGHGLGPGDGGPGIGPQGPVVGPAALHDAQLVKGLYRVQIPRGDVFGIGVGKGDRRIGVQVQSQPVGRHQGKVPPGDVAVGVEIGDVSAGDPGDDAQLTQAGGIGPGPVVGHVRKGVGGGAGEGHGIPGQIAAGVGCSCPGRRGWRRGCRRRRPTGRGQAVRQPSRSSDPQPSPPGDCR